MNLTGFLSWIGRKIWGTGKSEEREVYEKGRKIATAINILRSIDGKVSPNNLEKIVCGAGYGEYDSELSEHQLKQIVTALGYDERDVMSLRESSYEQNKKMFRAIYGMLYRCDKVVIICLGD